MEIRAQKAAVHMALGFDILRQSTEERATDMPIKQRWNDEQPLLLWETRRLGLRLQPL